MKDRRHGTLPMIKVSRNRLEENEYIRTNINQYDSESSYVVTVCNGLRLLPKRLADLVKDYGWFCVALQLLDHKNDDFEIISLCIFFGNTACFDVEDGIPTPIGECAEIYITRGGDGFCNSEYLCEYLGRDVGDTDDYKCDIYSNNRKIEYIDFIDGYGTKHLYNTLLKRLSH